MSMLMRAAALLALPLASLALVLPSAGGEKSEIKELMAKTHRGTKSPLGKLAAEVKSASKVDWDMVKDDIKKLEELSKLLAKSKLAAKPGPDKGVKDYEKAVRALAEAAGKTDRDGVVAGHKMLMQSCTQCHYPVPSLKDK
jgi:cytochrome c556